MNWKQLLGLNCRHSALSIPINRRQHCVECGETFVFDKYDLGEIDHRSVDHYKLVEKSINRVRRLLRWRKTA